MARAANPAFHDACQRIFGAVGYRPRTITVEPASMLTLERIARGEGCTLANAHNRPRVSGVAYRPLLEGERLAIEIAAAWPGARPVPEAARLAEVARRVLRTKGKR